MRVLLVTGFLGSGKTTFINKLIQPLRRNAGLAILVNDFGKESVSAEYGASGELEVRYLENGCVCCAVGPSLVTTIKNLTSFDKTISSVIIELNGIALPDQTKQTLGLVREIAKQSTCCVVNTSDFQNFLTDPFYKELLTEQVAQSDFIFINRMVGGPNNEVGLRRLLSAIKPEIAYLESVNTSLDHFFASDAAEAPCRAPCTSLFESALAGPRVNLRHGDSSYMHITIAFQFSGTERDLMNALSQTPAINTTLLRAKVMTVADPTRPRMIAQFAGKRWKTRRTETLGKPSLVADAFKNSLVGESLLASVVLSGADKSMQSLAKVNFLKAMRSKVLNLCEI
jgi:G3E family GTPase